jgi:heme-degrading monooxygenase HmoA
MGWIHWGLMCSVLLGLGLVFPQSAWADKTQKPLIFSDVNRVVCAVSVYTTTAETQKDAFKNIFKTSSKFYKTIPGFAGFAAFASDDSTRIVELTLWSDSPSYEAFKASLSADASDDNTKYYQKYLDKREDKGVSEPSFSAVMSISQAVAPPGMVPMVPGEAALLQISQFTPVDDGSQDAIVAAAQRLLDHLSSLYPAPRSAILLTGEEPSDVVLLANWGSPFEFPDLSQVPTLDLTPEPVTVLDKEGETLEIEELSDAIPEWTVADDHLYQIVKVIVPKANKA